jgi:hypothetical protein
MKMLTTDIPAWVRWIAQDEDGTWWGYECEPLQQDRGWYENEVGRYVKLVIGEANSHWQATLKKVK